MAKTLYEIAVDFYSRLKSVPEAEKYIGSFDQDYQFEIKGEDPFYLELEGGKLSVKKGISEKMKEKKYWDFTLIETDPDGFMPVFDGKIRPGEALDEERYAIYQRAFAVIQFLTITRMAQDSPPN